MGVPRLGKIHRVERKDSHQEALRRSSELPREGNLEIFQLPSRVVVRGDRVRETYMAEEKEKRREA